jgi:hypothetical protein
MKAKAIKKTGTAARGDGKSKKMEPPPTYAVKVELRHDLGFEKVHALAGLSLVEEECLLGL